MKRIRQAMAWLVATAFAATTFAAHAAPEKIFSVAVTSAVAVSGAKVDYELRVTNETPNGNSSINSVRVNLPGNLKLDTSTVLPRTDWPGQVAWTPSSATPNSVSVSNMSPLKPTKFFVLKLRADVSSATCIPTRWLSEAFTGSSFSGDTFRQLGNVASTTSPTYGLQFVELDEAVVKGESFNVTVNTTLTCPAGTVAPPATLSPAASVTLVGAPSFTGGGTKSTVGGSASWTPTFGAAGPATLSASAPGYTSASLLLNVFDGELYCESLGPSTFEAGPILPLTDPPVIGPVVTQISQIGYTDGRRGAFNKDGATCSPVAYTFVNDILRNNQVSIIWDVVSQPGAAFEYTATWRSEYVDATTGLPALKTRVKWAGLTSAVVGKSCLSPDLPEPYGTLSGALVDGVGMMLTVTPAAGAPPIPPVPFPIVVGGERMQVTAISGSDWTVARGQGGTTGVPHPSGASVMSTPLPLYMVGTEVKEMRMCIVSETWTTVPAGTGDCVSPDPAPGDNPPRACVRVRTTVFDVGDGVMIRGGG